MLREGVRFPGQDDDTRHLIGLGDAEGVALPVDDKHTAPGTAQLGVPGLAGLPWRVQRERQGDNAGRADLTRRAAGNPRPVRAAALDKRQASARLPAQHLDELRPGGVLLRRGPRRASAPDPVGLGHQGRHRAQLAGGVAHRQDVGGVRVAARAVGEHDEEGRRAAFRLVKNHVGRSGGGRDLSHVRTVPAPAVNVQAAGTALCSATVFTSGYLVITFRMVTIYSGPTTSGDIS
jgi:hypothetical protein